MDFRPVAMILGVLLTILGLFMLVPAAVDLIARSEDWIAFALSSTITIIVGITMILTTWQKDHSLSLRQAFLMVNLSWLSVALFASLPFVFSPLGLSVTDAVFESTSGITTTGSTIITGLDWAPRGLLLWRSILQWLGGIGFIVMAISILPMLSVGGMQLLKVEGFDQSEKILPRATTIAYAVTLLYAFFTGLAWVMLVSAGLTPFDAINHAMTSLATGGFSTKDGSIGAFDSNTVEWIILFWMFVGSLPFVLFLRSLRGAPTSLLHDQQVRAFLAVLAVTIGSMVIWLVATNEYDLLDAIRLAAFNVTSVLTGTGFATSDYASWGSFAISLMLIIMFIGGCGGSTSCGIKIFRFQVLFATAWTQLKRLVQPHGVFLVYYERRPISEEISSSVMSFFFLFLVSFGLLAILLGMTGLDLITAVSSAATAIANVGPGLGSVGPAQNFAHLPDAAKWMMSVGMLMGRLELFTVLVLLAPAYWRG